MKITDFALIFLLAFLPISIAIDVDQHRQIESVSWQQVYDEVMYTASEDATIALLQQSGQESQEQVFEGAYKSSKDLNLNLDAAMNRFLETVYINFGVDDKVGQDSLKANLPVQMVVGYDGLHIHTWDNVFNSDTGTKETKEIWMPKIPYSYYDKVSNITLNFTLDDYVYVYNNTNAAKDEGRREKLALKYPVELFTSAATFDNIRRQSIIQLIQKQLEFFTNRANYLSKVFGQGYIYNIPMISKETWNNTINDVCFISFLQGLTIPGTDKTYSTFGFGGTRVKLKNKFVGCTYNGIKYYHKEGCVRIGTIEETFNSKKEAARNGYASCPLCNP